MALAIIPARGGSKRIPKKNMKEFLGQPMISYSLCAAKESGLFEKIIVSTDSPEIAEIARSYGAEVPFLRPRELSDDHTATAPVLEHALLEMKKQGFHSELFCCIYPTAPLIRMDDLKVGYQLLSGDLRAEGAFSVTSFPFPIFRAVKKNSFGHLEMVWPEYTNTRSQDLTETFHDAGQFYWLRTQAFLREKKLWGLKALPVALPRYRVQDIDTPEDWIRAEALARSLNWSK